MNHANEGELPPGEVGPLAEWFSEAVRSEIAELEKDGGAQRYEVLSGRLLSRLPPGNKAIYVFIMADGTRLPEDAAGRLKAGEEEYPATVVAHDANQIQLLVESRGLPPSAIPRALLTIDDTALLRKLLEVLRQMAGSPGSVSNLAALVFHPATAEVSSASLPQVPGLVRLEPELRQILEQAIASPVTYLWGPPGTGKTFAIARLVTALLEQEERVLVSSHTHAAVDQALYEAIRPDPQNPGPLGDDPRVSAGQVLRLGPTTNPKIPDAVRLEKVAEARAKALSEQISGLQDAARPLANQRATVRGVLSTWDNLQDLQARVGPALRSIEDAQEQIRRAESAAAEARGYLVQRLRHLEKVRTAWFRRAIKVQRATAAVEETKKSIAKQDGTVEMARNAEATAHRFMTEIEAAVAEARATCSQLPRREDAAAEDARLAAELDGLETEIRELQAEISVVEQRLIQEARVIFCTLTKNYMAPELRDQRFNAVVVDEISMALPPLIYVAAARATDRVILVGDFLQLPPIVRSDSEVSSARLRQDSFHLAGVAKDLRPAAPWPAALVKLSTQRRMAAGIADAARHLLYGPDGIRDHASVLNREPPAWLDFVPRDPLVILDTADLHCWSGKQVGSLSRFNFYSATVAVELAAMAAHALPEPSLGEPPPIGIVTPFAAQRRLLYRLVLELGLTRWVLPGTVHTFQGQEADLIIFDAVLDEPYWAARLTTPRAAREVKRDLNVAITRARHKFVFLGSSDWLNRHAGPASALGQLWWFLKDRAPLVSAHEVVEVGFAQRALGAAADTSGWRLQSVGDSAVHEILDELSFFDRFAEDMRLAARSVFGLAPFFGEYRWPRVEPLFRAALARGVEVTLVIPPRAEASNPTYVDAVVKNLRSLGAVVVAAGGLHGKDIVIDARVHYTGSLNWASHRGRAEVMHRTESPARAKLVLDYIQANYIRAAAVHEDGAPRRCPECGGPIQVVNQRKQRPWDFQAMKVGCASYHTTGCKYLRNVDERAPFKELPRCQVDRTTKYRRVRRGRGEVWQCPKHPRDCETMKAVPGDPD